ncbi:MAG: hypothetical protein CBC05_02500 [Crocinitomicaceae bacterium TMED45]|nr:MAG: hypothetical protein CBC05_02500 [Crocinitomicaceae bacterium TMED45]|tara:strand:- start:2610 stop:2834 length:225 start_codon:yes stop_codon:yes gene_type:complete
MISKKEYRKNKPYWDYQRKVEFNREDAMDHAKTFDEDVDLVFQHIWDNVDPVDYDDPPVNWVPRNKKYQIEGEI